MAAKDYTTVEAAGREVRISSPSREYFPAHDGRPAITKLDLSSTTSPWPTPWSTTCATGRPSSSGGRTASPASSSSRSACPRSAPSGCRPRLSPSRRGAATELTPNDAAHLVWATNLGNIDWNPWPCRRADLDHPDELRVDLDPTPGIAWDEVRQVALAVRDLLDEHRMVGFPKTSGSRGIHVNVRIVPEWDFTGVRRAALALAREIERRMPGRATSKWWKEERVGVFLDYNQNARDRTVASAYSVRPVSDARVSTPLSWDEVADVEPADLRLDTVPQRLCTVGDPSADIDDHPCRLDGLLELARRDEDEGLGPGTTAPHMPKVAGEGKRVAPSRARKS